MQNCVRSVRAFERGFLTGASAVLWAASLCGQTATPPPTPTPQLVARAAASEPSETTTTSTQTAASPSSATQPQGLTVMDELNAMKKRIEQLES